MSFVYNNEDDIPQNDQLGWYTRGGGAGGVGGVGGGQESILRGVDNSSTEHALLSKILV